MMAHDHVMKDLEVSTTSGSLIRERILKVWGGETIPSRLDQSDDSTPLMAQHPPDECGKLLGILLIRRRRSMLIVTQGRLPKTTAKVETTS